MPKANIGPLQEWLHPEKNNAHVFTFSFSYGYLTGLCNEHELNIVTIEDQLSEGN